MALRYATQPEQQHAKDAITIKTYNIEMSRTKLHQQDQGQSKYLFDKLYQTCKVSSISDTLFAGTTSYQQ